MIKYMTAALGLRLFSVNQTARSAYRAIGNSYGQDRRKKQSIKAYVERGDLLVSLAQKYGLLDREIAAIELGTGWMHWFGMYLGLHSDRISTLELFDVWDNRQFDAMQSAFRQLQQTWSAGPANDERDQRLQALLDTRSFDELYARFNATYTVDANGSLASYADAKHDLVFSFHVLEHVGREIIRNSFADMYRALKPGGYAIHQIGIDDHLSHYDKAESAKRYISFSMSARKRFFENVVQYHNVLQASDYTELFEQCGFEIVEIDREKTDISDLKVHSDWEKYSREDLETTILTLVCRKPAE